MNLSLIASLIFHVFLEQRLFQGLCKYTGHFLGMSSLSNNPQLQCIPVKEKIFRHLLKLVKQTLLKRVIAMGALQLQRENELNSEYKRDKWRFIAKEQGGSLWEKNCKEKTAGLGGFLLGVL